MLAFALIIISHDKRIISNTLMSDAPADPDGQLAECDSPDLCRFGT